MDTAPVDWYYYNTDYCVSNPEQLSMPFRPDLSTGCTGVICRSKLSYGYPF